MSIKGFSLTSSRYPITVLLLLLLAFSTLLLLSGCTGAPETTADTKLPVDHPVDSDPEPLTTDEQQLS